tara:strand:+ start:17 stop:307 length:291 start_codon:yes stop_codon:yes gene_type:complete
VEAKPVVSIAFAVRAVEAVVFASTILIFAESEIAPLPDEALGSAVSSEVVVEVDVEEAAEELSSDFAQPRKMKLIIARKISKLVEFFTGTSLNNNS